MAPALAVLAVSFLLGALAGCLMSTFLSGDGLESLQSYLEAFLWEMDGAERLEGPALAGQLWSVLRWPLFALLLGFTALGVLGLPLLFAVRGFLLAYSIAAFVRAFGSAGCLLAFLVFGVGGGRFRACAFCAGRTGPVGILPPGGPVPGGGVALWPGLFRALRRVRGGALCVCVSGALCGARPGDRRGGRHFGRVEDRE